MNVSPQRFRVPLVGLLTLLASGTGFAQHAIAPRPNTAVAADRSSGEMRTAALPSTPGRGYRYGSMQRPLLTRSASYTPPHERLGGGRIVSHQPEMIEGDVIYEGGPGEMIFEGPAEFGGMSGRAGCDGNCGGSCGGGCGSTCGPGAACGVCPRCIPCPTFSLKSINVTLGVVGFKNGANRGSDGSFGFEDGINWTKRLPCMDVTGINAQLGVRGVHTNLAGSVLTPNNRDQLFVTAGLFRRVDWGLQFGAVADYLREDWYSEMNISQLRAEVSYVFPVSHELGFRLAQSMNSQMNLATFNMNGAPITRQETWEALDTYSFFYRFRSQMFPAARGECRIGLSNESHTLLGANSVMPLGPWVALQSEFTYLIPQNNTPVGGNPGETEVWNIGFGMVIYPYGEQNLTMSGYDAPLFDVGNNGSFITKRMRP
ncbi:MAG: hypothetical protein RIC55_35635 [Pirellulaceae bacterium]